MSTDELEARLKSLSIQNRLLALVAIVALVLGVLGMRKPAEEPTVSAVEEVRARAIVVEDEAGGVVTELKSGKFSMRDPEGGSIQFFFGRGEPVLQMQRGKGSIELLIGGERAHLTFLDDDGQLDLHTRSK